MLLDNFVVVFEGLEVKENTKQKSYLLQKSSVHLVGGRSKKVLILTFLYMLKTCFSCLEFTSESSSITSKLIAKTFY